MRRRRTMVQIVKVVRKTLQKTIIDAAAFTATVTGADIDIAGYEQATIYITAGEETGTCTLDAKLQIKDSNGNYYDHTAATQVTAAGSSTKAITGINGLIGRVVVTWGGEAGNKYLATTVEIVFN